MPDALPETSFQSCSRPDCEREAVQQFIGAVEWWTCGPHFHWQPPEHVAMLASCGDEFDGNVCTRPDGHVGDHSCECDAGTLSWSDPLPGPPDEDDDEWEDEDE